jgi:hypothetical protein
MHVEIQTNLVEAGVVETTPKPLVADHYAVDGEPPLKAAPHFDSGVVLPTVSGEAESFENLKRLNPLLA